MLVAGIILVAGIFVIYECLLDECDSPKIRMSADLLNTCSQCQIHVNYLSILTWSSYSQNLCLISL